MIRILSFFQEGCMACHEQEPINREVEHDLSVHIEPVNPLEQRTFLEKYNLRVTPTTVIEKDGQVVERFEGVVHREQLEDAIRKYL
jgi:thioredoxin 1